IANALIGAVEKHNKRHPDDPVVYLNWAAVTPAFTNENCMFWHFRFDAHVDMKMAALVTHISGDKNVKKIYLINQNYAFGQSVSEAAKRLLKERMPGVEVVGDDLFPPFGKVKDFSPYITKIKASGADTVITGNWGLDLDRLLKAAFDAGLEAQWLTYYGGATGGPGAIGKRGIGKVKQVNEWHNNHLVGNTEMVANMYKEKYGNELTFYRLVATLEMLATAADKAGNTKIVDIAKALEGMEWDSGYGKVMMRASDHQLQSPLVISVLTDDVKYDMDGAGVAFKTVQVIDTKDTTQPTTCKMERP
ncbi:MAG: ABC transporter substrate-binding protein, partial [Hyphomicrobiales bacterium]|nr:ABC transporter substrate-binding protein [Hyphomicrobiales bacterium]